MYEAAQQIDRIADGTWEREALLPLGASLASLNDVLANNFPRLAKIGKRSNQQFVY